jgi:amino acid transporter
VYIVLVTSYIRTIAPVEISKNQSWMIGVVFILIFTYVNIRGLKEISIISNIISMIILVTFAVITVVGFTHWNYNPMSPVIPDGYGYVASIGASLSIGMWMYSGYTSMSTLAGEVKDKSVIYKGLLIILPLTALSYILPTVAGLASVGSWEEWTTSGGISFGNVLALVGGWGLPVFLIVAVLSNLSIYNTQMISVTRGFYALSKDNLAPKSISSLTRKYHTPYIGIFSMAVFNIVASYFDFDVIVTVDVMLLMVDYVLVFISGARLRYREPDLARPFKIPGGARSVTALIVPGVAIAVLALFLNGSDYFLGGMIGLISSPIMYVVWKRYYGGMTKEDPEKYPINPKTKLGKGDLHRTSAIFLLFAAFGIFGSFVFFPWYESDWGSYYVEVYGGTDPMSVIFTGIKIVSFIYLVVGVALKAYALKNDPKPAEAGIW